MTAQLATREGRADLFGSKQARDEGMAKVTRSGWQNDCLYEMAKLSIGFSGTGEAIKLALFAQGLEKPHHHNAWGPAIRQAVKVGLLRRTHRYEHTKTICSHARWCPVYERI